MFNLFSSRKDSGVEIVRTARALTKRMSEVIRSHQDVLDALGEDHGEVDSRLLKRIDELIEPILGPSGHGDERWFQSMDYYGGGVRHLEFKPGVFPLPLIPRLQNLLVGEHASFCILCWAPFEAPASEEHEEGIVIFAKKLLLTPKLASASVLG
jgi:hypothetical protein